MLQYLVWQVQANVAKLPSGQAGASEAALAQKLLAIVRAAAASEALGPDEREWCRRMQRACGGVLGTGPTGAAGAAGAASGSGGPVFGMAPPAALVAAAAAAASRPVLPGGYNAVAGFSALGFGGKGDGESSSDDERPARGVRRPAAAAAAVDGASSDASSDYGGRGAAGASDDDDGEGSKGGESEEDSGSEEEEQEVEEPGVSAAASGLSSDPQAMIGAWGYPFGGPRSSTLFISRRSRRHRMLHRQLAAAFADLKVWACVGVCLCMCTRDGAVACEHVGQHSLECSLPLPQ